MLAKLLAKLDDEQAKLQEDVFRHAPADWPAFVDRLGEWKGIETARQIIKELMRDEDEKEQTL